MKRKTCGYIHAMASVSEPGSLERQALKEIDMSDYIDKQQWTPCSERMPEIHEACWLTIKGHDVIVCDDGETIEQAIERTGKMRWVTSGFLGSDGWYGVDGYPMAVRPIAWMPMVHPDVYEGEE